MMMYKINLRQLALCVVLFAAATLTIGADSGAPKGTLADPWLVLLYDPDDLTIAYMREDLATVEYVREVSHKICEQADDEYCEVYFWSDYELASTVEGRSDWTEEMAEKRLAKYSKYEDAESVIIFCPKDTIVIVANKPFCRPEKGYWILEPSAED